MGDVKIIDLDDPSFAAQGFPGGVPPAETKQESIDVGDGGPASSEKSESEKEKGNQAFRAGDFGSAVEHWSCSMRSCQYIISKDAYAEDPTRKAELYELVKILNLNLAIGEIKRQNFAKALDHCDLVLADDADNVKALLRKSQALFETHEYRHCVDAVDRLLLLEPNNQLSERLRSRAVAAQQQYSAKHKRMVSRTMTTSGMLICVLTRGGEVYFAV
eukprot:Lankesteria_metandrocarpae@DN1341_c0_g1_i2.p1